MRKKENWVWMPHPGHFIGAFNCHFWLNTYVGGYIVSTVGEYSPTHERGEWEELGLDRFYETYVFKATKSDNDCCPYEMSDFSEIDSLGALDPEIARFNHMKLCRKWSKK